MNVTLFFFILVSRASSDRQARPKQRGFKQRGTEVGSSPMTIFGFPAELLSGCYSSLYTIAAPLLHPLGRSQPPELGTLPPSSIKAAHRAKEGLVLRCGDGGEPNRAPSWVSSPPPSLLKKNRGPLLSSCCWWERGFVLLSLREPSNTEV